MTGRLRQGSNGAQAGSVCTVRKVTSSSDRGGHLARPRTLPMSGVRLELGFHRRSGGIPQGNRFHLPNRIVLAGEDTSGGARLTTGTRVPPGHQDHRWLGDWPRHRGRAGPFPVIQPAPLHKRPGGNRDGGSSRPPKPDPRAGATWVTWAQVLGFVPRRYATAQTMRKEWDMSRSKYRCRCSSAHSPSTARAASS